MQLSVAAISCFIFNFCLGAVPCWAQGLLLALYSGIFLMSLGVTIWDVGDWTLVGHVQGK